MLEIAFVLNALLMLAMPVALGLLLARRLGTRWGLFGAGALTFIASQVVRQPLLFALTALFQQGVLPAPPAEWSLAFNLGVLGISAGLFEEGARYLAYRFWIRNARTWREALMFGAGHGGIESILIGLLVALTFVQMLSLRVMDLSTLPLSAEQAATLAEQVAVYWSTPWPTVLLGAIERAFAITLHLSLSVMVLQAVLKRNLLWLLAAIAWHAAANIGAVYVLQVAGAAWSEAVIGSFAVLGVVIIFAMRRVMPDGPSGAGPTGGGASPAPALSAALANAKPTAEQLDESRYE